MLTLRLSDGFSTAVIFTATKENFKEKIKDAYLDYILKKKTKKYNLLNPTPEVHIYEENFKRWWSTWSAAKSLTESSGEEIFPYQYNPQSISTEKLWISIEKTNNHIAEMNKFLSTVVEKIKKGA